MYGKELILDIHNADNYPNSTAAGKTHIEKFMIDLCGSIGMTRMDLHFWVVNDPVLNLYGTTACQFINESSITIHTLDRFQKIYLNVFSCKDFDEEVVEDIVQDYFGGDIVGQTVVDRL